METVEKLQKGLSPHILNSSTNGKKSIDPLFFPTVSCVSNNFFVNPHAILAMNYRKGDKYM